MGLLSSLVGGIFGMASQNATNKANIQMMREQNEFNRQEAEKARDFQVDMWNKSNDYNTPAQQMQRLTEAGLNPNLVYGNGTSDMTAAAVPSTNMARASSTPTLQNPSVAAMNIAQALASIKVQNQQAENMEQQNKNLAEDTRSKRINNDILENTQTEREDLVRLEKRIKTYDRNIVMNKAYQESLHSEEREKELQKLDIDLTYYADNAKTNNEMAHTQLNNAIKIANKQVELMNSEMLKNRALATQANIDYQLKKWELDFKNKTMPQALQKVSVELQTAKYLMYKAYEEGKTEVSKSMFMNAQRQLTNVLSSKAYQDLDLEQQQSLLNLLKGTVDVYKTVTKLSGNN